ncbi:hypothetical protein H310_11812 [Aphanomyces invadans]|uniref:Cytochrome P450 n=1 Tax=Aphanomyces invadans TaxID=157072 RepID=A0A024TME2_9STRA|nr:hypothetical protein H310_11812 [Aphanomyces invadans]ETV94497.1 hypothetical protein H310_11812 [Aphanomyces invadans]|eukprot:XP_008876812.1 hypothetical protein H310_11812 [Aphanomyces invadans]
MSSTHVVAVAAAAGMATVAFLVRWLQVKPFIPSLKMAVHLHHVLFGVGDLLSSVEGLGRVTFDEADDDGMCQFWLMGLPCISVLKAEHVRAVVVASNYRRRLWLLDDFVDAIVGKKSLVQVMGHEWKVHRKLISKAFGWQNLANMAPVIGTVASEFAAVLLSKHGANKVDVFPLLKLATLDVIGATAFGASFNAIHNATSDVVDAFTFLLNDMNRRSIDEPLHPASSLYWLPTSANRDFHAHKRTLRRTIDALVAARLARGAHGDVHHDLLQYMIDAAHDDDSGVTRQSFADNLLTFLFAGYDTTSIALAYTLHLIAAHPEAQAKAVAEIDQVVGPDALPTYDMVHRLTYCAAVVMEALRLFPPVLFTMRTLEADVDIGGHLVPKDTNVILPIYWIHRYEANWGPDATAFRPDRHLTDDRVEMTAKDKAFRMMAFSGGPRNCVGMRFAMMEAVVLVAVLLRQCAFSVPSDAPPVQAVVAGLVQNPQHGVWLDITPRKAPTA